MFHGSHIHLSFGINEQKRLIFRSIHCTIIDSRFSNANQRPVSPCMQERSYADIGSRFNYHDVQIYTRVTRVLDSFKGMSILSISCNIS